MNRIPLLVVALALPVLAANRSEARPIPAFHAIDVSGGVHLIIKAGGAPALTIAGEEKVISRYRTEVKDGTLVIAPTERNLRHSSEVTVTVSSDKLDSLEASGGVEVTIEGGVASTLGLDLSGGVEVTAKTLSLESLAVSASGGVNLHFEGATKRASYDLSGGVDLHAAKLSAGQVKVEASGGCNLNLRATEAIEGEASGGVEVRVSGNPPKRHLDTSGGADVEFVKS
jgi:hypothetical protein